MRLGAPAHVLTLQVTGYQFPDAEDLRQRYSWHMIEGEATCARGTWRFRYPALTCDESPRIPAWLDDVAACAELYPQGRQPGALKFTEPNLGFSVAGCQLGEAVLKIALDLEFQPPWHRRKEAGDPFCLMLRMTAGQLRSAAREWDDEIARYPDGTAT